MSGDSLFPNITLSEGQWVRIAYALDKRGTKADDALAARIRGRVAEVRRRHESRLAIAAQNQEAQG